VGKPRGVGMAASRMHVGTQEIRAALESSMTLGSPVRSLRCGDREARSRSSKGPRAQLSGCGITPCVVRGLQPVQARATRACATECLPWTAAARHAGRTRRQATVRNVVRELGPYCYAIQPLKRGCRCGRPLATELRSCCRAFRPGRCHSMLSRQLVNLNRSVPRGLDASQLRARG